MSCGQSKDIQHRCNDKCSDTNAMTNAVTPMQAHLKGAKDPLKEAHLSLFCKLLNPMYLARQVCFGSQKADRQRQSCL
eukprot:1143341-Pelagomonas_calceolata.AAC.2